jgi:hypothetical protein
MSICLLDSSILCEILEVPGHHSQSEQIQRNLKSKIEARETLVLPLISILEVGKLIAQHKYADGTVRRKAAERFVSRVREALQGESPFTPTPFPDRDLLLSWLDQFPDWAMREKSLGDLGIAQECERQRSLNPGRKVYIWSKDEHLSAYGD